jgi:hypothetical protein
VPTGTDINSLQISRYLFFELGVYYYYYYIIQLVDRFEQRPEPSQTTGIDLVSCILAKFLWAGRHYFPPRNVLYTEIILPQNIIP